MKSKLRITCIALLAACVPAWALQLGQIEVKSALNQPLVASIPLHPKDLTELDGLTVALAPAEDFARAGLMLTPTDRTLQFHVVTDNNGQKLILVTSSEPITDPYLDFLVQVNTRSGRQVREFVVLLNPVIAAPAPVVQAAPVASVPAANPPASQPAELPPSSAFAQPAAPPASSPATPTQSLEVPPPLELQPQPQSQPTTIQRQPQPKPAPPPETSAKPQPGSAPAKHEAAATAKSSTKPTAKVASQPKAKSATKSQLKSPAKPQTAATHAGEAVKVAHGDTLYGIAKQQARGTDININQLMLALKAANSEAFFKNNINDLKAEAILRIPTHNAIDKLSIAEANAEVHRQYEAWRAARPHPATVLEGTAVAAAANAAPKPGNVAPASDHLTLVPPANGGGASNRPGVAGGTGKDTVTGLRQKLQNDRDSLISLNQSNADLESRVRSLEDITGKSDKLLSLKDATIAELQHKLAAVQSGAAGGSSTALAAGAGAVPAGAASTSAASPNAGAKPAPPHAPAAGTEWYMQPLTWLIAGLVVLALILIGLFRKRRGDKTQAVAKGPLPDPEDIALSQHADSDEEASLQARIAEDPEALAAHLALCRFYFARGDENRFIAASRVMREHVRDPDCVEWREAAGLGEQMARHLPVVETPAASGDDPFGLAALRQPASDETTLARAGSAVRVPERKAVPEHAVVADTAPTRPLEPDSEAEPEPVTATALAGEPDFSDDPVDTKLDLARAYLDMGDPVGARAMLEEVLEEGSQSQKDEATHLLAEVASV